MSYVSYQPVTVQRLHCSHPRVKRIWEFGGGSANPSDGTLHRFISIVLDNEERHEFRDQGDGSAIKELEQFLKDLPE